MKKKIHGERGFQPDISICGLDAKKKKIMLTIYYNDITCENCLAVLSRGFEREY